MYQSHDARDRGEGFSRLRRACSNLCQDSLIFPVSHLGTRKGDGVAVILVKPTEVVIVRGVIGVSD